MLIQYYIEKYYGSIQSHLPAIRCLTEFTDFEYLVVKDRSHFLGLITKELIDLLPSQMIEKVLQEHPTLILNSNLTLKDALQNFKHQNTKVAAVFERGEFLGVISQKRIKEELDHYSEFQATIENTNRTIIVGLTKQLDLLKQQLEKEKQAHFRTKISFQSLPIILLIFNAQSKLVWATDAAKQPFNKNPIIQISDLIPLMKGKAASNIFPLNPEWKRFPQGYSTNPNLSDFNSQYLWQGVAGEPYLMFYSELQQKDKHLEESLTQLEKSIQMLTIGTQSLPDDQPKLAFLKLIEQLQRVHSDFSSNQNQQQNEITGST